MSKVVRKAIIVLSKLKNRFNKKKLHKIGIIINISEIFALTCYGKQKKIIAQV